MCIRDSANIAHGCNSVMATRMAMRLSDYTITEAGFGADLGAEKFLDIKCRFAGIRPDAVVVVATVRALKNHGGAPKNALAQEDLEALERGLPNLLQHVENITQVFGLPCVVALNEFPTDTEAELNLVAERCRQPVSYTHLDVYKRQALVLQAQKLLRGLLGPEVAVAGHLDQGDIRI